MEYTVSSATIMLMTAAVFICLAGPVFYLIAIRKKLMFSALLLGLVGYIVFGHYGAGVVQSLILPPEGTSAANPVVCAVLAALSMMVVAEIGRYLVLGYAKNRYDELGAALSFGAGYSIVKVMLMGGANIAYELSVAVMVAEGSVEEMVAALETQAEVDALYELLTVICEKRPLDYLLGGLELAAFFAVSVSFSVLVWYAVKNRAPIQNMLIPVVLLHFLFELPGQLYNLGANVGSTASAVASMLVAVAAVIIAYRTAMKFDPPSAPHADPVNRFQLWTFNK